MYIHWFIVYITHIYPDNKHPRKNKGLLIVTLKFLDTIQVPGPSWLFLEHSL